MPASHHEEPKSETEKAPRMPAQGDLFADGDFEEEVGQDEIPETAPLIGENIEAKIVEVAPGQFVAVLGREAVPRYGIIRFDRRGNDWIPVFVGWGKKIALRKFFRPDATGQEPHPILQCLGLDLSYNSILRLFKNGFIRGSMPVPHRILIDIESLNRHLEESSDPDFWTPERVKQFKETIY